MVWFTADLGAPYGTLIPQMLPTSVHSAIVNTFSGITILKSLRSGQQFEFTPLLLIG